MKNYQIYKLFPTPVFHFRVENYQELNTELENYILNLKKRMKKGKKSQMLEDGTHIILISIMIIWQKNLLKFLKNFTKR